MKTDFREHIQRNKWKTWALFFFFLLFLLTLGWVFGEVFQFGILAPLLAFVIALLLIGFSYFYSDSIVLKLSNAKEVKREDNPRLYHLIDGLAIAAGIPKPKAFIIEDEALNAFATGRDPEHGVICITTGLLKTLDKSELEGVLAHEMSHILNQDIKVMAIIAILVGFAVLFSDFIFRWMFWGRHRDMGKAGLALLALAIVLAILTPFIATIIKFSVSRQREFLADASSVQLTRYPDGLASALQKISASPKILASANKATAHLFISNPLKQRKKFLDGMFSTHPPIEERIKRLQGM